MLGVQFPLYPHAPFIFPIVAFRQAVECSYSRRAKAEECKVCYELNIRNLNTAANKNYLPY